MSEPRDMIIPLLREMREENLVLHARTREDLQAVQERLDAIEKTHVSFRHALAADSLLARLVTGDFEERIVHLEKEIARRFGGS